MCQVDGGEFILDTGTRKGMLYPEGREPVPMSQEADLVGARKTAPPPVFDPRTVQPVASRYIKYVILDPSFTRYLPGNFEILRYIRGPEVA